MSQLNQSTKIDKPVSANNKKDASSPHSSPTTKSTSVNELFGFVDPTSGTDPSSTLDLNNNSNAYKQLVKNLSNHPLSAPPAKFAAADKLNNSHLFKTHPKKATSPDSSNILKQLLNINLDESEEKKTTSSSARSAKKSSAHHHSKKSKSPKDKNVSFKFLKIILLLSLLTL